MEPHAPPGHLGANHSKDPVDEETATTIFINKKEDNFVNE